MGFKFRLESLLKLRKRKEESAQIEYILARKAVDNSSDKINKMYSEIDHSRIEIFNHQNSNGQHKEMILHLESYIEGLKTKIELERNVLRQLIMEAEEKQFLLSEASKEFKILDKLKEKKLNQYKEEILKKESSEIDELVVLRFKNVEGEENSEIKL